MLIFFTKSQFNLFDTPVNVAAHVRKDGSLVAAHTRIQKVAVKHPVARHQAATPDMFAEHDAPAPAAKRTKLDAFIDRKGGIRSLGSVIATLTEGQQQTLFAEMGKLGGKTAVEVSAMFDGAKTEPEKGETPDLFAEPAKPEPANPPKPDLPTIEHDGDTWHVLSTGTRRDDGKVFAHLSSTTRGKNQKNGFNPVQISDYVDMPSEPAGDLVEHTTKGGKGKTIRGVIRTDLTQDEAKAIDPYTFKKDGGWFIREKHLSAAQSKPKRQPIKGGDDLPDSSVIVDDKGQQYRVHYMRSDLLVTHPIIDGKAQVNSDSTVRFRLSDDIDPTSSERPGPIYLVSKPVAAKPTAATVDLEPVAIKDVAAAPHDPASPFGVAAGITKPKRRDINAAVMARLADGGPYSPEDLAMFRQYSGNGGCGDSLNEYYTDPDVARGMWTAIAALGVTGGTALEPSCATGVFLHTAPAGFQVTGVELDPTSAAVASALHGDRHEIHTACLERFATADDRQFDVVIGNPPYGPRGKFLAYDKKQYSDAEQYFTDTSLDKCKPGGIVALVVPTGIMDSKTNRSLREDMLRKGEFLGAQRMPNTAFEHSHTEVTTDVIYLRKRPDDVAGALGTVDQATLQKLGVWDEDFVSGSYFTTRGADNVLGTMTDGWRAKAGMGNDITVEGSMDGVAGAIADFKPDGESAPATAVTMQQVLDALPDEAARDRAVSAGFRRPYAGTAKVGDTKVVDGITYVLQGDPPRWHSVTEFMQSAAISDAQALAADIDTLMTGSGAVDRPALEAAIRAYVDKHGVPADNVDLMTAASVDRKLFRLVGAVDRKGRLSDAVRGRVRTTAGGFDATAQILAIEHTGDTFLASELAERLGKPVDEVEDQLVADPRYAYALGGWTTMDAYLTGDLWIRFDAATKELELNKAPELADKLRMQLDRLEKKIDAKSLDDVEIHVNSAFVPVHVLSAFLNWKQYESDGANDWTKKQQPVEVSFADGVYAITGGNQYGDVRLIDKYLNRTGVKKDERDQVAALNTEFKDWLCASTYRDSVEEQYNRSFRGFVAPEYSNEPIDVPGLATDRTVRDWRWSSLRRSLATGKGIIADDVGLGKTLGGLLLARMAKVQGSAKKPIIVVPKSVLANWYEETQVWFPGCKVLTIGANFTKGKDGELVGKDDAAGERKRKYHDLTQNDYDFILISEPAFEEVDLDPIKKEEYYGSDFWVQRGEALGNAGDKRRKAIRENYEQAIAKREFSDRTDAIYFNELGVDMLIADEMHHQKNLYAAKARFGDQPKFLGGQGLSNRALDFNLKTRWIREQNDGKNVHGLTATPTKNSPLEIYSMLSHIAPEAFERIKIRNSEEFLDRFCEFTPDKVLSTAGEIEDATVVSGFKNLDELREIMERYIDRRTAEQVGLKLPSRDDRMHLVDMTRAQQDVYAELRELAEESAGKKDATGDAHIFAIMDKMNKAALDLSLLDPKHAGADSPKYKELAKQCVEGAKQGGQIVFSEYIASHDKIVAALVDAGFKREEIGVINAQVASSSVKRQNIAQALNSGKLRVVVGNCTMAEGLNMQKTTTDIHHMDVPWEPATLQQRNGRGLRQGNMNESLRIHTYLSKGSFDGYRYQAVAAKKDWQDLLWNGGDRVDNLAREGAFTLDDMRIMLSADPEAARAKFDEDKTEATKRYEAGERTKAQAEFVRFSEMSRSYRSLKNKATASGERLRLKMEASKTSLFNNKHWPAKAALDSASDVLIHPQTGTVLAANQGLDFEKDGKMVVTGVNMRAGTVTMRHHASTAGARQVTLPISELADAKPFKFDSDAEAAEVGAAMTAQAEAKLNSLTSWEEVKAMPSAVLEKNHDLIQKQIKDGAQAYKFRMPYGDVPMVNRETGKIEMISSYEHTKKHDTHDYMLPTDSNKEKAIQAWMDARRSATIGTKFVQGGKRGSQSKWLPARQYTGTKYDSKHVNPLKSVLGDMSGGTAYGVASALEKQAKARLDTEQQERIRRAPDAKSAIEAIMPLAKVGGDERTGRAEYPEKALATLWARLRHLGALGKRMTDMAPYGHSTYAFGSGGPELSAHHAIVNMAKVSGHATLADALAESAERHVQGLSDIQTLQSLSRPLGKDGSRRYSARAMTHMLKVAERAGLADSTIGQLREHKLGGSFEAPQAGYYGGSYMQNSASTTLRTKINEILGEARARETIKEAA